VTEYAHKAVDIMSNSDASFILQNFYVKELAHNVMVQRVVAACAWDQSSIKPAIQPKGSKVGFIDMYRVLWHVSVA
jgi:hypothetical protein